MKVVAFVPAKGTSERIPSKNLRVLDGEHLFKRKLKQLLRCSRIDEVWLDTDSDQIIKLAADLPVKILKRDTSLASNKTDGHAMFENECRHAPDADIVVQALCTAPFVDEAIIDRALKVLIDESQYDSLTAVRTQKFYTWSDGTPDYGSGRIPNSVDLSPTTVEAMSLYMVKSEAAGYPARRFGRQPLLFEISPVEDIDINTAEELELAEHICAGRRLIEASYFRVLKHHLNSSILSDVAKELGLKVMVDPEIHPTSPGKVLGRVKTLRLTALPEPVLDIRSNNSWKGIYGALNSYEFIRPGDVIVVENEVPNRAYFGDLNCHLAMRAGAVGVLVDGFTRDVDAVSEMGMPVYARGRWSNDIKYEGTTHSYNMPIQIGGVPAKNDDVVFADNDGVLVVPGEHWQNVLDASLEVLQNEGSIRHDLLIGRPITEVIRSFGYF